MRFEKPEVVRNINQAVLLAAVALAKIQYQDPVSAGEGLPKIWAKVKGELEKNPEHIAWTFIASCVSTACVMLLREPRLRCELTDKELQLHARELVELLTDAGELHANDLTNLALSQYVQCSIEHIPQLINSAAPDAEIDDDHAKQAYREMLARSVTAVFERQPDFFKGMTEAVQGATSTAERRDVAWKRHSAWVRGLFHETPIFSPDSDIDVPLSSVYQRLRCYWHTEHEKEEPDERENLKYRTATVAELHDTVDDWLKSANRQDSVRLIAGGPGSGKSSFAKAYSAKLIGANTHRVLFIQLQHLTMHGTLKESIGRHLTGRHGYKWPNKTEGFPQNPLDWHGEDTRPLLLVFDGLDELTTNKDRESDLTKKFVSNLKHVLNELNTAGQVAAALVLGRDLAMDAARDDGDLSLNALIHVAPIRCMTREDLRLTQNPPDESIAEGFDPVSDPLNLLERDSRTAYWKQWCRIQGMPDQDPSPAITDERMSELNVEPLLLHLLIISDFCGERWEQAAENRNLIYNDILRKVFNRNKAKELDAYKSLNEKHFFELMEVFGLAAFRGNGRTGDHEEFKRLRKRYATPKAERSLYSELDGASLKNVALMVHSRQDLDGAGFEFVHKSFGEYLAARALLGACERLRKLWVSEENDENLMQLALRWVDLIGGGQMSASVLRFLRDECSLRSCEVTNGAIETLSEVFDWALAHGFPVQKSDDLKSLGYRKLEFHQKCAEMAMLVTIASLWASLHKSDSNSPVELLEIQSFAQSSRAASDMIDRLFPQTEIGLGIPVVLSGFVLERSDLYRCRAPEADLGGANLSRSILHGAELNNANLKGANLFAAQMRGAHLAEANLRGAVLFEAKLSDANLRDADLSEADLKAAFLGDANLNNALLNEADLTAAHLVGADLSGAILDGANLNAASLFAANLSQASLLRTDLRRAELKLAELRSAKLMEADLSEAELIEADLSWAKLNGSNLSWAKLNGSDLMGSDLSGSDLRFTDLSDCKIEFTSLRSVDCTESIGLSQSAINTAFGVKSGVGLTRLPNNLSYPDHWHIAKEIEEDSDLALEAYSDAWLAWQSRNSEINF